MTTPLNGRSKEGSPPPSIHSETPVRDAKSAAAFQIALGSGSLPLAQNTKGISGRFSPIPPNEGTAKLTAAIGAALLAFGHDSE